jgi:hypothetical protein
MSRHETQWSTKRFVAARILAIIAGLPTARARRAARQRVLALGLRSLMLPGGPRRLGLRRCRQGQLACLAGTLGQEAGRAGGLGHSLQVK